MSFTTPAQAKRQRAYFKARRNPAPGRTANESKKIRCYLERLARHIMRTLALTEYKELAWFPHKNVITDRDDEHIIDWRAIHEPTGYETDDSGNFVGGRNSGLRISNRISAVTVYKTISEETDFIVPEYATGSDYMVRKTVYSPLPCNRWGSLPLTLAQWRIIAMPLIYCRALWQWSHAVRDYTGRNDFVYDYIVGWELQLTRKPFNKNAPHVINIQDKYDGEPEVWTGSIIFKQITDEFSDPITDKDGKHP